MCGVSGRKNKTGNGFALPLTPYRSPLIKGGLK